MAKLFKWLMVMLIPLFSLTFTSCGGDDKDEPDVHNPVDSEIFTETYSWGSKGYLRYGNVGYPAILCYTGTVNDTYDDWIQAIHSKFSIVYIPNANSINAINSIPTSGWSDILPFEEGGYIAQMIENGEAKYIRFWVTTTHDASGNVIGYTVKSGAMSNK